LLPECPEALVVFLSDALSAKERRGRPLQLLTSSACNP